MPRHSTGRKQFSLKYTFVVLPEEVDQRHSYHRYCYQRFTALSKVHRNAFKERQEARNTENSASETLTRTKRSKSIVLSIILPHLSLQLTLLQLHYTFILHLIKLCSSLSPIQSKNSQKQSEHLSICLLLSQCHLQHTPFLYVS